MQMNEEVVIQNKTSGHHHRMTKKALMSIMFVRVSQRDSFSVVCVAVPFFLAHSNERLVFLEPETAETIHDHQ